MYIKIENTDGTFREGEISEKSVVKIFELIFRAIGAIPTHETADNENEQKN